MPDAEQGKRIACDAGALPPLVNMKLCDPSGSYILLASLEIVEGNNQELRDQGRTQLLALKETLRQAVTLAPAERLALDTRMPNPSR